MPGMGIFRGEILENSIEYKELATIGGASSMITKL